MTVVIPLAEATVANAGPKMGRLGELMRRGGQVPDGFVVTADAAHADDDQVVSEVAAAYARLCGQSHQPVAVRSSAVDEDGAKASFAGVYESYLGLRGADDVMAAVRACWSAADSERAIRYRDQMAGGGAAAPMAVGVMLLVPARSSGVVFTVDPITGRDDRYVIEATFGFGEPVVQGFVVPDRIELAATDGRLLRYEPGDKRIALTYEDGEMNRLELPAELAGAPALTAEEVAVLYDGVRAVVEIAGEHVDCEWALDHRGRAWIVQWRPVTALPEIDGLDWDPAEYAARYAFRSG